jgi:hypothetical protein
MSALNVCLQYYSNDFSNLTQESHSQLSSLLSSLNSCDDSQPIVEENEDHTVWINLVEQNICLPNKQPSISSLKKNIEKMLNFNFVQLCVDFYTIKNNNEDNSNLCEKSYDQLQDIMWKLNTCSDKNTPLDSTSWSNLRPKQQYARNRNTGDMELVKTVYTTMPRKSVSVQFIIDRMNKLININNTRISQIKQKRADDEQTRLLQLQLEAQQLENTPEPSPSWDYNPSSTQLISEPEPEPLPAVEPEPEVEAEEQLEPEVEAEEQLEPEVEAEEQPKPEVEAEEQPEPEVEVEEQPEPEVEVEEQPEPEVEAEEEA